MEKAQKKLRVLVLGSGGREHALAWRIAQSPRLQTPLYCAPGNPGMAEVAECIADLKVEATADFARLFKFVEDKQIDLVVVGPEAPLSAGVVDAFNAHFIGREKFIFGPTKDAAKLEWSKVFSKEFCFKNGIPTARAKSCETLEEAKRACAEFSFPVVLKADGLAAGKGVVIALNQRQLDESLDAFFVRRQFGDAAKKVLVEEFVAGEEASFFALCDGVSAHIFPTCQDHKRIFDGDQGPNTGGMGAYSPAPVVTPDIEKAVIERVVNPLLKGMAGLGTPYVGMLYVGLMIDRQRKQFSVLEYNCRFGDPEAQVLLMRLQSDFIELALAACQGRLRTTPKAIFTSQPATCVVLAASGYPGDVKKGDVIRGLQADSKLAAGNESVAVIFHAGTALKEHEVITAGGRVLGVCALGRDLRDSIAKAYARVSNISFAGMQYRKDIGAKGHHL